MKARPQKQVRCAIYTRVSTDQGLEQDFNSLDAQYDASQAYIRSQVHAGRTPSGGKYDDGGFSGGNTDRPALQRLLDDIAAGKIDVIVVYTIRFQLPQPVPVKLIERIAKTRAKEVAERGKAKVGD